MGKKYKNIKELYNKKINVHNFKSISNLSELINYSKINNKFSMRFDRDINYHQLPFYKYDKDNFSSDSEIKLFFSNIIDEANRLECSILCSNGYMYDNIQICNFVIKINNDYDFTLEFSTQRVALREMYNYPTTVVKGNIKDSISDMEWVGKESNFIDNNDLEKIISWAFNIGVINKNIEATLYPKTVGLLNEQIVCWQTD